jgi:hypothetical protein
MTERVSPLRQRMIEMLWGVGEEIASIAADANRWSPPVQKLNDLSQSRSLEVL